MPLVPIELPPGVYRNGTERQSAGRWYDMNQVRFFNGTILPRASGAQRSTGAVTGKGRRIIGWRDNSLVRWVAVGTESHLYAMTDSTSVLHDITPSGFTTGNASAPVDGAGNPTADASIWCLDTFGQYLVGVMAEDGIIYEWTLDTAVIAAAVSGAPTATALVMTDERFLFALGAAGVPRRVQWADQASLTAWTPLTTNQAGSFDLQSTGKLMCGKKVKGGTLLLTTFEAYLATYVGGNDIYGFPKLAEGCGAVSRNCVAEFDGNAVWMSNLGFWLYNGFVQQLPCDVLGYLNNMEFSQISKVSVRVDPLVGEITWHYPSINGTGENDSYISWSYREWAFGRNVWSFGSVGRLSGTSRDIFVYPQCVGTDGYIYNEEVSFSTLTDGTPYIESGPFELGNGDVIMYGEQLVPDEATQGDLKVTIKTKFWPNGAETTYGPYTMANPTDVRFSGRQAKIRFTDNGTGHDWVLGRFRLDLRPGGQR